MAAMKKTTRSRISPFTVNMIFEKIEDQKILRSSEGRFTFAREESFFLLNQFVKWKANIVFCGHVHKWDDEVVGGVTYLTLDSMCEENNPDPGDYLVRVHVKKNGTVTWEKVHMNTRKK